MDSEKELRLLEIIKLLYASKKVTLEIDLFELEYVKTTLYRMKRNQDSGLIIAELMEENEVKELNFRKLGTTPGNKQLIIEISMNNKKKNTVYRILSVGDAVIPKLEPEAQQILDGKEAT